MGSFGVAQAEKGVFWSDSGRKMGGFTVAHTSTVLIWEYHPHPRVCPSVTSVHECLLREYVLQWFTMGRHFTILYQQNDLFSLIADFAVRLNKVWVLSYV